jgi:DNA primase
MNSRFDDTAKEEIRLRINIADLVGRYVKLKPVGQNFKGLCPFHKEKTPSFIVTPSKGIFHCFGCNKGGDIFAFLQEMEGLEFKDAIKQLADEAGVKLTRTSEPTDAPAAPAGPSKTEMLAIHEKAAKFFYRHIKDSPVAVEYFKSRGLKPETVRDFILGYAPPGWSNLVEYMKTQGIQPDTLVACGLALQKSDSRAPYDRFRERIVFTLFDAAGKPIGFAARTLKADEQPKYLNSPETLIYKKSQTLYGLHKARPAIKQENSVLIVEGYMDYLALFQAGVQNVVATSGTAMTTDHGLIIRRFTSNVFLVFDGDGAGIKAAERGVMVLAPHNFDVRVLILPDEEDPDEFIKKHGAEKFRALLKQAQSGFSFLLERFVLLHGLETPQAKSAIVEEILPYLQTLTDDIVKLEYIKQCAERLGIPETLLHGKLKIQPRFKPRDSKQPAAPAVPLSLYSGTLEENFLRILLIRPELAAEARLYIRPDTLTDSINSKLYSTILGAYEQDPGLHSFIERLGDPQLQQKASALAARQGPSENLGEDLTDLVVHLQRAYLKRKQHEITMQLKKEPQNREKLFAVQKQIIRQLTDLDKTSS